MGNNKASMATTIVFVFLSISLIGFVVYRQSQLQTQQDDFSSDVAKQVSDAVNQTKSSDYPDYASLSGLRSVSIASNFESWTPNSTKDPEMTKKVIVIEKGTLSKAYILAKVSRSVTDKDGSVHNEALSQWESFYMTVGYVGGHIFRPYSLKTPPSDVTTLLFALNDVPYLKNGPYSETRVPAHANWFAQFVPGAKLNIETFISSLRPAEIGELTLYYECVDDDDCEVSLSSD